MTRTWIVGPGDGATLGDIVRRLGEDVSAVSAGRVFVGKRRAVHAGAEVRAGDQVTVEEARAETHGDVRILAEWDGVYAVEKPAGLPTEPDKAGDLSLVRRSAELLGARPGEIHAATRLDAAVSGIVVVARGAAAARRVADWKRRGVLRRRYVALVAGVPSPDRGVWDAPVGRGPRGEPSISGRDARPAATRYRVAEAVDVAPGGVVALLAIELVTGRRHQIRLHAAHAGVPLLGDARHGGPRRRVLEGGRVLTFSRPALHAGRIAVDDGTRPPRVVVSEPPGDLVDGWVALGGRRERLLAAVTAGNLDAL